MLLVRRINRELVTEFRIIQFTGLRLVKALLVSYIFFSICILIDKGVFSSPELLLLLQFVSLAFIRVRGERTSRQLFLIIRELEVCRCLLLLFFHSLNINY